MKSSAKVVVVWTILLSLILMLPLKTVHGDDEMQIPNLPPKNPYLADSVNSMGHNDPAQQDSTGTPGPTGPPEMVLEPDQINYQFIGAAYLPASISSAYTKITKKGPKKNNGPRIFWKKGPKKNNGPRIFWSNGPGGIVKLDHDSLEVLAHYELPAKQWTNEEAETAIATLESLENWPLIMYAGPLMGEMFKDITGIYTVIDNNNGFYVGSPTGVTVYGDAVEGDRKSEIEVKRTWDLPVDITGKLVGMNMTYDGWLILATDHGYVVAVSRDMEGEGEYYYTVKMAHSEGAKEYTERMESPPPAGKGRSGYGWVRNGYPIDKDGGIYIASLEHMHKVVWKGAGEGLSIDEEDGAWAEPYLNGWGFGTGATPSLMGFGDEDKFVVITDGETLMNVVIYWRDEIPGDWEQLPGAPSRRIAGMLPADMGGLEEIQSEQSVVVSGYGAAVVNNTASYIPPGYPKTQKGLLNGFLGARSFYGIPYAPYGIQKFEWDPDAREFREAWVNTDVSSPNCVPLVSASSSMLYVIGTREGKWTLEGLDWITGESVFNWIIGGERYNSLYSAVMMDADGRIIYANPFGRVALEP